MKQNLFETYMNTYKDNVYAVALNYLRNPQDAGDVVQNTFLKLYCSLKSFESEEHVRNWLIRVAINECRKLIRKKQILGEMPLEELMQSLAFEQKEQEDLFSTIMGLEEKYRVVVHLYYYEGYSTKEIAGILKVSDDVVRQRLARARAMLKEALEEGEV